jgi:type IV pilus assembly protein PilE
MKNKGFTIIELMIVIGIIGVLAVIAVPLYSDYLEKARRSDAKVALTGLAQAQESYHSDYLRYASLLGSASDKNGNLGCRTSCEYSGTEALSPEGYYTLVIEGYSASNFTISATAKSSGAQAGDTECKVFAIDGLGRKAAAADLSTAKANLSAATPDPNECW